MSVSPDNEVDQTTRSVELIDALMDHHAKVAPSLQEVAAAVKDFNHAHPDVSRRLVLRQLGYVPSDAEAWVRWQAWITRTDVGSRPCRIYDAA